MHGSAFLLAEPWRYIVQFERVLLLLCNNSVIIPLLVRYFRVKSVPLKILQDLLVHFYPGHVRALIQI